MGGETGKCGGEAIKRGVEGRTRPAANSLRLLPLGPDRIGEAHARADLPAFDIGIIVGIYKDIVRVKVPSQALYGPREVEKALPPGFFGQVAHRWEQDRKTGALQAASQQYKTLRFEWRL